MIFYHADDFGVTMEQSKKIYECYKNGILNSVSIIPNSPNANKSYELIADHVKSGDIRLVIHLNFVEGHPLAPPEKLPHLINASGLFSCSYGRMLKINYSHKRKLVQKEFEQEISAQIGAISQLTNSKVINVDSHQHYLQIPMIFQAFLNVVNSEGYTVNYLRNPVDPASPVLSTGMLFKVPFINYIKWLLLGFLAPKKSNYSSLGCNVPLFFGMPFTCQMSLENVKKLLPKYMEIAKSSNKDLELMFHPGAVLDKSSLLDPSQADLVGFYSSDWRQKEFEALQRL